MTWPEVLDRWSVPPTLIEMWEFNRKKILEYVQGQFPKHASLELLNSLVLNPGDPTLRRSLVYVEPLKPASLATFSDVPVKQKQDTVFIDVVTNAPVQEKKKPRTEFESLAEDFKRIEEERQRDLARKEQRQRDLERREGQQRHVRDLTAAIKSIRPW